MKVPVVLGALALLSLCMNVIKIPEETMVTGCMEFGL